MKTLLASAALAVGVGGCAPSGRSPAVMRALQSYEVGRLDVAADELRPLADKTDENYVLNNVRLGSVALSAYDLKGAETAFFRAYEVINSTKVNDPGRKAAAVFLAEQVKVWKGEPFERAMANFYLGLVYYMQRDYNNARAAFENSLFKLRDYGEKKSEDKYEEVESNFTIAYVMLAKCWQKLGDEEKAQKLFSRVAQLRPELAPVADVKRNAESNVLLVADFGDGPNKVLEGDNSVVAFRPVPEQVGPMPAARVSVDGKPIALRGLGTPPIDLLALAQDRRWQSIDTIRVTKSVVGTGLMGVGAYQAGAKEDYGAAAALIAAGALLKASATGDVRYWELLPRTVYLIPLKITPGRRDVTVTIGGVTQTWRGIVAPSEGEAAYYLRVNQVSGGDHAWPPAGLTGEHFAANVEPATVTPVVAAQSASVPPVGTQRISRRPAPRTAPNATPGSTAPAPSTASKPADGPVKFDYGK